MADPNPFNGAITVEQLSGLELFIDAVKLGSISAAARTHHLSQPSATERLRSLERRIGVVLLRRGPGGSAPTPEGEAIAVWAKEVLGAVERLSIGVAAVRAPGDQHPMRIMASLTVAEYVMPAWLHAHRQARGRPVEMAVGNSVGVIEAVATGDAVLGFVETPRRVVGLRHEVVGGDHLVVVVGPTHPWARRRARLSPEQLATTPLLTRELGSGTRDSFEAALARCGLVAVEPVATLASTTALKAAVASGDGATVLSELTVADEIRTGALSSVAVEGLDLTRQFRAVWRGSSVDSDVRRFVKLAISTPAPDRGRP